MNGGDVMFFLFALAIIRISHLSNLGLLSNPTKTIGENSEEVGGNNRSVMPLDVLGDTRATFVYAEGNVWHGMLDSIIPTLRRVVVWGCFLWKQSCITF